MGIVKTGSRAPAAGRILPYDRCRCRCSL